MRLWYYALAEAFCQAMQRRAVRHADKWHARLAYWKHREKAFADRRLGIGR
ncbi:MAG: hypothetical protein H6883_07090 [Rhodobiaceae bacterium]|nr:hypothetical protein [Rhodobiaceae bacterium]MCC0055885.1 hypothetical protein [Rhodobiaceae bacterium]